MIACRLIAQRELVVALRQAVVAARHARRCRDWCGKAGLQQMCSQDSWFPGNSGCRPGTPCSETHRRDIARHNPFRRMPPSFAVFSVSCSGRHVCGNNARKQVIAGTAIRSALRWALRWGCRDRPHSRRAFSRRATTGPAFRLPA